MTEANRPRRLPGWVTWFTTDETTRTSFRRDAWFHLFGGLVLSGIGALACYFGWLPWKVVLLPAAWVVVGLWMLAAGAWLDRNQAWHHVASQPEQRSKAWVGGSSLILMGLLLLGLSVWRLWVCLLGPDASLVGAEFIPIAEEELQLVKGYNARLNAIQARGDPMQEGEEETRR